MTTSRSATYWAGRRARLALCVWGVSLGTALVLWREQRPTYLLGQVFARYISALEVIGVVGGLIAATLLLPRAPVTDRLSARPLGVWAAAGAGSVAIGFASVAWLVAAIARLAPQLLPPGTFTDVVQDVRRPDEVLTTELVLAISATVAFVVSIALMLAVLLGRTWGMPAGAGAYLCLLLAQSTSVAPSIPFVGGGPDPYGPRPWATLLATIAVLCAMLMWGRTRGALRQRRR